MKIPLFKSTDLTNNGQCSKCGNCCSNFLPLTEHEIKELKKFVKKRKIKPTVRNFVNGIDGICPFLTLDNKCSIYQKRPYICKLYKCNKRFLEEQEAKQLLRAKVVNIRETFFPAELMKQGVDSEHD